MYDVVVIGAGQAGLAAAYYLKQTGLSFRVIDKNQSIGDSWRHRYDSLKLFTPRMYNSLPGLTFPGPAEGLPTKNEVADYLSDYATFFGFPIFSNTKIHRLEKENDSFLIRTDANTIQAKKVIVATGPFQTPSIPSFSARLGEQVTQIHSAHFRNASQLRQGTTLVVGAGNSGAHIASELSESHEVHLASGSRIHYKPLKVFGKSIFWYYEKFGFIQSPIDSIRGRIVKKQPEQIYGFELKQKIEQGNIHLQPRVIGVKEDQVYFEGGATPLTVKNVVWATGYKRDRPNHSREGRIQG